MKEKEFISKFCEYSSADELAADEKVLLNAAREAAKDAYAPYSHFHVGAAVLLKNKKIITANNQENAAYPSGLCAERVAIFSAAAQNPNAGIAAIAITASSPDFKIDKPVTPCGACRQAIAEYESRYNSEIKIIMSGVEGTIITTNSIKNLLPLMFSGSDLKKK